MAPVEQKLFRCEPDDPDRCQADGSGQEGQCRFLSVRGIIRQGKSEVYGTEIDEKATNCPKHKGQAQMEASERKRIHDYNVGKWQEKLLKHTSGQSLLTLYGEVGIVKFTLENLVQQCKTEEDLVMYSSRIADLSVKLEKLVATCQRLEQQRKLSLDRPTAILFASQIVEIISDFVDPEQMDEITERVMTALSDTLDTK